MAHAEHKNIANDNSPIGGAMRVRARQTPSLSWKPARTVELTPQPSIAIESKNVSASKKIKRTRPAKVTNPSAPLLKWISLLVLSIGLIGGIFGTSDLLSAWPVFFAMAAAALMVFTISKVDWRLREMSSLLVLIGCVAGIDAYMRSIGLPLGAGEMLAGMTALATIGTYILRTRFAHLAALLSMTAWAALAYVAGIEAGELQQPILGQTWLPIIPVALAALWSLALRVQDNLASGLAVLALYAWLAIYLLVAPLSSLMAYSLLFIVGVAHHRLGKSWGDLGVVSSKWHDLMGWGAAVAGAWLTQSVWLTGGPDIGVAQALPLTGVIVVSLASCAIIASSLIRFKAYQISTLGFFLLTALSLLLPFAAARPERVVQVFESLPGISATPGFGLLIGGAIIASALGVAINGMRRGFMGHILAGAAVMAAQALVLVQPGLVSLDSAILIALTLLMSLSIGCLISGAATAHTPPLART